MSLDNTPAGSGPLDKMFRDTNIVILIIFGICCSFIAFILGLVGLFTAKDSLAKRNALIVTIIGGLSGGVATTLQLTGALTGIGR